MGEAQYYTGDGRRGVTGNSGQPYNFLVLRYSVLVPKSQSPPTPVLPSKTKALQ